MPYEKEVCTICNKELDILETCFCTFETQTLVTEKVKLCPWCWNKVKQFIDFQSFRNS